MTKTNRKKPNKLKIALLAPILAITFIVGWSIYWIGQPGHKQPQKPINKTPTTQDKIELIMIPQEEQTITN